MRPFLVCLVAITLMIGTIFISNSDAQTAGCVTTSSGDDTLEYDVTIVFTGLMTFVPQSANKTATVIIPDVKTGNPDIGDDKHTIHNHFPYILARTDAMCKALPLNTNHPFRKTRFEPETYHFLELNGEQISVDDDNAITDTALNPPLDFTTNGTTATDQVCPDSSNVGSLYWISSMKTVTGTAQTPDPDHFAKQPDRNLIAGRVVLRQGKLTTHVIKKSSPWEFRIPKNGGPLNPVKHTQALAQEVLWTFKARGVPFVLNLNSFDGTSGRRVAFVPDRTSKKLTIIIGNTTFGDTGPIANPALQQRDDHYSVYYQSVNMNAHGDGPIPHLVEDQQCKDYVFSPTLEPAQTSSNPTSLAAKPSSTHAHAMAATGQPAPSGLNCSPNQWP